MTESCKSPSSPVTASWVAHATLCQSGLAWPGLQDPLSTAFNTDLLVCCPNPASPRDSGTTSHLKKELHYTPLFKNLSIRYFNHMLQLRWQDSLWGRGGCDKGVEIEGTEQDSCKEQAEGKESISIVSKPLPGLCLLMGPDFLSAKQSWLEHSFAYSLILI